MQGIQYRSLPFPYTFCQGGIRSLGTEPDDQDSPVEVLPSKYQTTWIEDTEKRIYLIGAGALGTLVAHQLACLPDPPPITILVSRMYALEKWREVGEQLKVTRHGVTEARKNITAETTGLHAAGTNLLEDTPMIRHLIVTLKAPFTRKALDGIKHRLDAKSTIVFMQNGQGVIDEINEHVFPDPSTRPRYILSTVTHGVTRDSYYNVTQHGVGSITLSLQPTISIEEWEESPLEEDAPNSEPIIDKWPPSARYLMRTITRAPMLKAAGADPWEGFKIALLKLAANAIVNPLTALFDCKNGELLYSVPATRLMNLLLAEVSLVFRSLPEARSITSKEEVFGPENLKQQVLRVCRATAENSSSMLQDIRAGNETEIDYINGWIFRRGEDLGIKCILNYAIVQMVKAKSTIGKNIVEGNLPLELPRFIGMSSDAAMRAKMQGIIEGRTKNAHTKTNESQTEGSEQYPSIVNKS